MRKSKDPVLIKELLAQATKQMGLEGGLEKNKAMTCWKEVVGEKIASKSKATRVVKETLYIKTESPVWSQQLSLMEEQLRAKVNRHLGREVIKNIRFRS